MAGIIIQKPQIPRTRGAELAVFATNYRGLPFEEGLRKADAEGRVIVSNKKLDSALVRSDEWEKIKPVFACWSGTMAAYIEPDIRFSATIVYTDQRTGDKWVFPVPKEHRGKRNAILIAEHPDYTLETDGRNRIVHATAVALIEGFPSVGGLYLTETVHGIPFESQLQEKSEVCHPLVRVLIRSDRRVGPVIRGAFYGKWQGVVQLAGEPSTPLGIAVESSVSPVGSEISYSGQTII